MSWKRCGSRAGDEDQRPRLDRAVLRPDGDDGTSGDHVVDLVLRVRRLRVDPAGLQHVQPDREVRHAEELLVQPGAGDPARLDLGKLPSVHRLLLVGRGIERSKAPRAANGLAR